MTFHSITQTVEQTSEAIQEVLPFTEEGFSRVVSALAMASATMVELSLAVNTTLGVLGENEPDLAFAVAKAISDQLSPETQAAIAQIVITSVTA